MPIRLTKFLTRNALVLLTGLGVGIYRCAHEWPAWLSSNLGQPSPLQSLLGSDFYVLIDAAKIGGVLGFTLLCYLADKNARKQSIARIPSATMAAACVVPLALSLGVPLGEAPYVGSLVTMGCAAGMLFCQWVEVCGLLTPIKIIQALALSYVVRCALLPLIAASGPTFGTLLVITLAGSAFLQTRACFSLATQTPQDVPAPGASSGAVPWRRLPSLHEAGSLRGLFVWVPVFAFAYGLGVSSTGLAHSVVETGVGKLLPAVFILVASAKMGSRFDRGVLYAIALPLMAAGLIGTVFLGALPWLAQMLLSAAMASFRLLAFAEVCSFAHGVGASAMFLGSCVRVLSLASDDTAVLMARFVPAWNYGVVTTAVIMAAIFVGTVVYAPRVSGRHDGYGTGAAAGDHEGKQYAGIARQAGLTQRETAVFELLAKRKTTAQISEELFISHGAVRAHSSNIYRKLGVHSREELERLVG